MASLRDLGTCIGLAESFSVLHGFFGYREVPKSQKLSTLAQMRLMQGKHLHLNLIRVGTDSTSLFSDDKELGIDASVHQMRKIYAQADLGVGRVEHFAIPAVEAAGLDRIGSDEEARLLTAAWSVPNDGLDVFLVLGGWTDSGSPHTGLSDTDNTGCDKDGKEMSGSVVAVDQSNPTLGDILAHEVGHYLGLHHINDLEAGDVGDLDDFPPAVRNNLMFPREDGRALPELNFAQGAVMRLHCLVQSGC